MIKITYKGKEVGYIEQQLKIFNEDKTPSVELSLDSLSIALEPTTLDYYYVQGDHVYTAFLLKSKLLDAGFVITPDGEVIGPPIPIEEACFGRGPVIITEDNKARSILTMRSIKNIPTEIGVKYIIDRLPKPVLNVKSGYKVINNLTMLINEAITTQDKVFEIIISKLKSCVDSMNFRPTREGNALAIVLYAIAHGLLPMYNPLTLNGQVVGYYHSTITKDPIEVLKVPVLKESYNNISIEIVNNEVSAYYYTTLLFHIEYPHEVNWLDSVAVDPNLPDWCVYKDKLIRCKAGNVGFSVAHKITIRNTNAIIIPSLIVNAFREIVNRVSTIRLVAFPDFITLISMMPDDLLIKFWREASLPPFEKVLTKVHQSDQLREVVEKRNLMMDLMTLYGKLKNIKEG